MVSQKQIEKWKEEHGEVLHLPFGDGKECYLKQPDRRVLGLAYAKGAKDPLASAEVLLNNCWLAGDEEVKTGVGYLLAISDLANEIAGRVNVEAVEFANEIHFQFENGKNCVIRRPNRQQASEAMLAARRDPISMVESFLRNCWESGDLEIKTNVGYLISLVQEVDRILEVKTVQVKKI